MYLTTAIHPIADESTSTKGEPPTKKSKVSSAVDVAADRLRTRYLGKPSHAKTDWPKHCVFNYVKLAIIEKEDVTLRDDHIDDLTKLTLRGGVDKILKKKKPINDLREIFHYKNEPIPRLILIMGSLYSIALHSNTTESNSITGEPSTKKSSAVDVAADRLRTRYLGKPPHAKTDWPKHCVFNYVKLAIIEKEDVTLRDDHIDDLTKLTLRGGVDKILKKKKPINDLREIFHYKNEPIPRMILIMGGPGEHYNSNDNYIIM